jgi:hypothetical protein
VKRSVSSDYSDARKLGAARKEEVESLVAKIASKFGPAEVVQHYVAILRQMESKEKNRRKRQQLVARSMAASLSGRQLDQLVSEVLQRGVIHASYVISAVCLHQFAVDPFILMDTLAYPQINNLQLMWRNRICVRYWTLRLH